MRKRWSVRTYLWLLALAVAAPCAGVLVYSIASDAAHDERQVEATTLSLAQAVGSQTQQFLSDAESIGTKLCERPLIRALDPSQRDPVFDQFLDWHPQFANLTVRDATGRLIHSAKPVQTENPSVAVHREWIEAALRTGGFVVGKPALGQVSQR